MGEYIKREIKPFNEFWINCESTMLHSLLITLDEKYRVMAYTNNYVYEVLHFPTLSRKWVNEVARRRQFEPCLRLVIFQFATSTSINVHPVRFIPFPCKLKNHKRRSGISNCDNSKIARRLNEAMRWYR